MSVSAKNMVIVAMPPDLAPATRLGECLNCPVVSIEVSRFPDSETKLFVPQSAAIAVLYCSLYEPDPKLFPLILAASALRDLGADQIILVAPYLCYMRQDKAFRRGEPVSQKVMAQTFTPWIDHIVTVEPHLHRIKNFGDVFPDVKTTMISAAPLLGKLLQIKNVEQDALLIGPDEEAHDWTCATALYAGLSFATMSKTRHGDRNVRLTMDSEISVADRKVFLIDDVASTGETLAAASKILKARGAGDIEALVAHALCGNDDLTRLRKAGVLQLYSTDTVPHSTNAIQIAALLAQTLETEVVDAPAY